MTWNCIICHKDKDSGEMYRLSHFVSGKEVTGTQPLIAICVDCAQKEWARGNKAEDSNIREDIAFYKFQFNNDEDSCIALTDLLEQRWEVIGFRGEDGYKWLCLRKEGAK